MKIGMVLSGGGAKGAYQIGLFRAMEELGLYAQVTALSGCSIGALNALLFAGADAKTGENVWHSMGYDDLMMREAAAPETTEGGVSRKLSDLVTHIKSRGMEIGSLGDFLAETELLLFSQNGMRALVRDKVDFAKLKKGPSIWVCAYNLERERPEYFSLTGLPEKDIIELAMASSSIPMMFPPVFYDGYNYCDGGIVPPYSRKKNADKLPVKPLLDTDCDLVIIVYLSHYDKVDLTGFHKGTRILELYPSAPLEMIKGAGTLNLSRETLADNMLMGYNDGLAALAPMLLEQWRSGSVEVALKAHREYNIRLLEDKLPLLQRAEEALKLKLSETKTESIKPKI